jgi:hypothetical protein
MNPADDLVQRARRYAEQAHGAIGHRRQLHARLARRRRRDDQA